MEGLLPGPGRVGWLHLGRLFSNSLQAGGSLHVGDYEGGNSQVFSKAEMTRDLPNKYFAGIVCVAN